MSENKLYKFYTILEEIGKSIFLPDNNIKFYCDFDVDLFRVQLLLEYPKNNKAYIRFNIEEKDLKNCNIDEDIKIFAYELILKSILFITGEFTDGEK